MIKYNNILVLGLGMMGASLCKSIKKNKISNKITSHNKLIFNLEKFLSKKRGSKKEQSKIKLIGKKILDSTHKEVIFTLKNEI